MLKDKILLFILLFASLSLLAQNDTIFSENKSEQKKSSKKQKKKNIVYNDTIRLFNNDLLVGEIKKMDQSVITFKTKYSDKDFRIKWHKIKELYTNRYFIISMSDGRRLTSDIKSIKKKDRKVSLQAGVNSFEEDLLSIIYLDPIGKSFLSRFTVDIDFGITLTKANNLRQYTSNLSVTYIEDKWSADGFFKSVFSTQDEINDLKRNEARLGYQYYLPNDWFLQFNADYLSNDEQLLKLRSTYKGGLGYYIAHNNSLYFGAAAGLAWTTEKYTDGTSNRQSGEAYLGLGFNKYDIGDLSLLSSLVVYPSFTENGRLRTDFNFDMKYDLPFDLYIKSSLNYNYDNKPIEGASREDYVFTTSFGWEFN